MLKGVLEILQWEVLGLCLVPDRVGAKQQYTNDTNPSTTSIRGATHLQVTLEIVLRLFQKRNRLRLAHVCNPAGFASVTQRMLLLHLQCLVRHLPYRC